MLRKSVGVALCCFVLASVAAAAGPRNERVPTRFSPSLDTALTELAQPVDGRLWSAWTYRSGGESDVAISALGGDGTWSEPVILGLDDGRDQGDPALAASADGTVYLVFADHTTGALMLSAYLGEQERWIEPQVVPGARGTAPVAEIIGDLLVIGYQDGGRTRLTTRPRQIAAFSSHTIYDGPDPVGSCLDPSAACGTAHGDEGTVTPTVPGQTIGGFILIGPMDDNEQHSSPRRRHDTH